MKLHLRVGSSVALLTALMLVLPNIFTACRPGPEHPRRPPLIVHYLHVETIDVPTEIRVGQEVRIGFTVSANASPGLLADPQLIWSVKLQEAWLNQAVTEGRYLPGMFLGPHVVPVGIVSLPPGRIISPPRTIVDFPVTFSEPGTQYLYIGHIADPALGGYSVESHPAFTDTPPFEYIEVEVEVLP